MTLVPLPLTQLLLLSIKVSHKVGRGAIDAGICGTVLEIGKWGKL